MTWSLWQARSCLHSSVAIFWGAPTPSVHTRPISTRLLPRPGHWAAGLGRPRTWAVTEEETAVGRLPRPGGASVPERLDAPWEPFRRRAPPAPGLFQESNRRLRAEPRPPRKGRWWGRRGVTRPIRCHTRRCPASSLPGPAAQGGGGLGARAQTSGGGVPRTRSLRGAVGSARARALPEPPVPRPETGARRGDLAQAPQLASQDSDPDGLTPEPRAVVPRTTQGTGSAATERGPQDAVEMRSGLRAAAWGVRSAARPPPQLHAVMYMHRGKA